MAWLIPLLEPYAIHAVPVAFGFIGGWTFVQYLKSARRSCGRKKLNGAWHKLFGIVAAALTASIAYLLGPLPWRESLPGIVIAGFFCPAFWGLMIDLTEGRTGKWGSLHYHLKGNNRRVGGPMTCLRVRDVVHRNGKIRDKDRTDSLEMLE